MRKLYVLAKHLPKDTTQMPCLKVLFTVMTRINKNSFFADFK